MLRERGRGLRRRCRPCDRSCLRSLPALAPPPLRCCNRARRPPRCCSRHAARHDPSAACCSLARPRPRRWPSAPLPSRRRSTSGRTPRASPTIPTAPPPKGATQARSRRQQAAQCTARPPPTADAAQPAATPTTPSARRRAANLARLQGSAGSAWTPTATASPTTPMSAEDRAKQVELAQRRDQGQLHRRPPTMSADAGRLRSAPAGWCWRWPRSRRWRGGARARRREQARAKQQRAERAAAEPPRTPPGAVPLARCARRAAAHRRSRPRAASTSASTCEPRAGIEVDGNRDRTARADKRGHASGPRRSGRVPAWQNAGFPPVTKPPMRLSQFHLHTSKETPADAEVISHKLMLQGRHDPQARRRPLHLVAAGPARAAQGRARRARGNGRAPARSKC